MKYEDMKQELNDINNKVKIVNPEYTSKLTEYINCTDRIKDISELLQEAETIRKKYNKDETKEKVNVVDADGRKKIILKDNEQEYTSLVEEKKHLMNIQKKMYNELMKIQSTKDLFETKSEEPEMSITSESTKEATVESNVNNEQLSVKKELSKKEIFLKTVEEFSNDPLFASEDVKKNETELSKKEKFLKAIDEFYSDPLFAVNDSKAKEESKKISLVDLNNYLEKNNITIKPLVDVKLRRGLKTILRDSFVGIKKKVSIKKLKKLIPSIFNIDKYTELALAKLNSKLLDRRIYIKGKTIEFKDGVKQKYNTLKTSVTNIPKRTKRYIKEKYEDLKKYINDKKQIRKIKEEKGLKVAMEEVYGKNKDKYLDYQIVNRYTNFKESTCNRINSAKGKITNVAKSVRDTIAKPFNYLRENIRDNVKRSELQGQISIIRQRNLEKKRTLKNANISNSSGYVVSAALITVSVVILSILIFTIIGKLLSN